MDGERQQTKAKKTLKVTLVRSTIGFNKKQAAVVAGMGCAGSATRWSCRTRPRPRDDSQGAAPRDGEE
jgi:hypothetical protein